MKRTKLLIAVSVVAITAVTYAVVAGDRLHFLDGYLWANDPTASSYTPESFYSFNRMGGAILVTRSAPGKYKAEFTNLSPLLGKSIAHVTGYSGDTSYCNGTGATVTGNVLKVDCFNSATGLAEDAYYSLGVTRNYTNNAFAYANQPTGNDYVPPGGTSWNPQGAIHVFQDGTGAYHVTFSGLGNLASSNGGHFQAQAVGTAASYCNVEDWGGSPDLSVYVFCRTGAGVALNTDFNVLFELPSPNVAYAWANQPTSPSYTPSGFYSWNPSGGSITITRSGTGQYNVSWSGLSLLDGGNVQVTAYGASNAQCKVVDWGSSDVNVSCFTPGGSPADTYYTVFLGS
jgi:hypothetical protein